MQIWATDWLHNHDVYWSADGEDLFFPYHGAGRVRHLAGSGSWRCGHQGDSPGRCAPRLARFGVRAQSIRTPP